MEGVGGVAHAVSGTQQPWKLPAHHAEAENPQVFEAMIRKASTKNGLQAVVARLQM